MTNPTLSMIPSQRSTDVTTYRKLTMQFGDGYQEDAPDGINTKYRKWQLVFENITTTEMDDLTTNVLDVVGTWNYFSWTPPGEGTELKWKVDGDVSYVHLSGSIHTVSFNIKQVFEV